MEEKIRKVLYEARVKLDKALDQKSLETLYVEFFGKNSPLVELTKKISGLDVSQRPKTGQLINAAKKELEKLYEQKKLSTINHQPSTKFIDVTAPGKKPQLGHLHLVSQAIEEIVEIFTKLGFSLQSYPEIDWDYYVFESLNMPADHPARDDWETFFIANHRATSSLIKSAIDPKLGKQVLTPHTSNGQIREMEEVKKITPRNPKGGVGPPIRMINISRCYRRQVDVSHTPMFHQFEGLLIDKDVSISDLKGTFDYFSTRFFGPSRITRLRPHHFRFTEPSFEVDVTCDICEGRGCRMCKGGWLELGGAGMVHPKVLASGKIDPEIYTGFAFGWGIERTIAMKTKVPDIRLLYQNDLRFLEQF